MSDQYQNKWWTCCKELNLSLDFTVQFRAASQLYDKYLVDYPDNNVEPQYCPPGKQWPSLWSSLVEQYDEISGTGMTVLIQYTTFTTFPQPAVRKSACFRGETLNMIVMVEHSLLRSKSIMLWQGNNSSASLDHHTDHSSRVVVGCQTIMHWYTCGNNLR